MPHNRLNVSLASVLLNTRLGLNVHRVMHGEINWFSTAPMRIT